MGFPLPAGGGGFLSLFGGEVFCLGGGVPVFSWGQGRMVDVGRGAQN